MRFSRSGANPNCSGWVAGTRSCAMAVADQQSARTAVKISLQSAIVPSLSPSAKPGRLQPANNLGPAVEQRQDLVGPLGRQLHDAARHPLFLVTPHPIEIGRDAPYRDR